MRAGGERCSRPEKWFWLGPGPARGTEELVSGGGWKQLGVGKGCGLPLHHRETELLLSRAGRRCDGGAGGRHTRPGPGSPVAAGTRHRAELAGSPRGSLLSAGTSPSPERRDLASSRSFQQRFPETLAWCCLSQCGVVPPTPRRGPVPPSSSFPAQEVGYFSPIERPETSPLPQLTDFTAPRPIRQQYHHIAC